MKVNALFWEWLFAGICVVALLAGYYINDSRTRRRHSQECFDAMLRMLLQPTSTNIATLNAILLKRRLAMKRSSELLRHAEIEADCLSIMPTGEMRASQPFLERRYNQILTTAEGGSAVVELVKKRLSSF